MKKIALFIFAACLFLVACSKDTITDDLNSTTRKSEKPPTAKQLGIENNGEWLAFKSQAHYDEVFSTVVETIDNHKYSEAELEDEEFDYGEYLLESLENELGQKSLRAQVTAQEEELLASGMLPVDALNSIVSFNIDDEIDQTFVTTDGAIQVGDDITIYGRNHKVVTKNPNAAKDFLTNGVLSFFNPDFAGEFTAGPHGSTPTAPECTAEFMLTNQRDDDGVFLASFFWAGNMDAQNLDDLKFVWDFGDGSDPQERSSGNITHTFANPGDYSVCLTVSWVFKEANMPDVTCGEITFCENITIDDILPPVPCGERLCTAVTAFAQNPLINVSSLFIKPVQAVLGQLYVISGPIVTALQVICPEIRNDDITFEFNNMTIQSGEFFTIECNGQIPITVNVGDCSFTVIYTYGAYPEEGCHQGDLVLDWVTVNFDNDQRQIAYKLKTKTRDDGGNRQMMWARVKPYEFIRGQFRKRRANLKIELSGNIYSNNPCPCTDNKEAVGSATSNGRARYLTKREPVYQFAPGISPNRDDPWFATFTVDGQEVHTGSCFINEKLKRDYPLDNHTFNFYKKAS